MVQREKYHCPFSDSCKYGKKLPEIQRHQLIERIETHKPVYKRKEFRRGEYKCTALKELDIDCSWTKYLNMTDLSLAMSFTTLVKTDCISYALKMTKKNSNTF